MSFPQTAARSLDLSMNGVPWHGPSFRVLLSDVTAEEATQRVLGSHSILELVLHVTTWIEETASRLEGRLPAAPRAGDWPIASPDVSNDVSNDDPSDDPNEAWERAKSWLTRASDRLRSAMERFPEARLDDLVGGQPGSVEGSDITFGAMMIGIAEHNAYHAGQIALLKRSVRSHDR